MRTTLCWSEPVTGGYPGEPRSKPGKREGDRPHPGSPNRRNHPAAQALPEPGHLHPRWAADTAGCSPAASAHPHPMGLDRVQEGIDHQRRRRGREVRPCTRGATAQDRLCSQNPHRHPHPARDRHAKTCAVLEHRVVRVPITHAANRDTLERTAAQLLRRVDHTGIGPRPTQIPVTSADSIVKVCDDCPGNAFRHATRATSAITILAAQEAFPRCTPISRRCCPIMHLDPTGSADNADSADSASEGRHRSTLSNSPSPDDSTPHAKLPTRQPVTPFTWQSPDDADDIWSIGFLRMAESRDTLRDQDRLCGCGCMPSPHATG